MIDNGMRRGLLRQFPASVPISVLAAQSSFYVAASDEWPQLRVHALDGRVPREPLESNVIVDGLDTLVDPLEALRVLRTAMAAGRLFALVANAVYAPALVALLAGDPRPRVHPLVATEVDALFAASGWRTIDRVALTDRRFISAGLPYSITVADVTIRIDRPEVGERLAAAGYLVVAEPA